MAPEIPDDDGLSMIYIAPVDSGEPIGEDVLRRPLLANEDGVTTMMPIGRGRFTLDEPPANAVALTSVLQCPVHGEVFVTVDYELAIVTCLTCGRPVEEVKPIHTD
jgi:hypothetical protein